MNDESLRSDDLFKSGSGNGCSDTLDLRTRSQNATIHEGDYYLEPRLHLLNTELPEDSETHVKNFDFDSLAERIETLSIDGDDYADIRLKNSNSGEELNRQAPVQAACQDLPIYSMANSAQSHQSSVAENNTGARVKTKDKDNSKTKKQTRSSTSNSGQIFKAPFKLQHKRYDNEFEDGDVNTAEGNIDEPEILPFPVDFLNPYSDPRTAQTIRPDLHAGDSAELELGGLGLRQEGDNPVNIIPPVVRPKVCGNRHKAPSEVLRIRHNNSDPGIHIDERQNTNRHNAELISEDLNREDSPNKEGHSFLIPGVKLKGKGAAVDDTIVPVLGYFIKEDNERIAAVNKASRNKTKTSKDGTTPKVVAKPDTQTNVNRLHDKGAENDHVNLESVKPELRNICNSPPRRIEFINNLDSCTAKKIDNKDMKNRNRNTENNLSSDCSANLQSVQSTQPLQYHNLEQVIDLQQHVNRNNLPNSQNFVERLKKTNNSNTEPNPIIVPYGIETSPVTTVLPSFDESLQSNVLFGDGTEMNDLLLAKMLQEQFDKEHEEMCRHNQYDLTPETLRLHNLEPNLNVADGEMSDQNMFGEHLQPDSLYHNDVYETSPRFNEPDREQHTVHEGNHSLEIDSDLEFRNSVNFDDEVRMINNMNPLDSELNSNSIMQDNTNEADSYRNSQPTVFIPLVRETDNFNEGINENRDDNTILVPYETEHHREVLAPQSPDEEPLYVRAEGKDGQAGRSDEDFALSLQRRLLMEEQEHLDEELARQLEVQHSLQRRLLMEEQEHLDEELARQLEQEEVDEERHRGDRFRSRIRAGRRSPIPHQPLHSRYSIWNGRPNQDRDEPVRYSNNIQIQNTWDRPLRQTNVYNYRTRGPLRRQHREVLGYDIYGNEYEPDLMPDQYGEEDFVSITRDPHLLASMLMERAPNMMVPDNIDMDDYEALWDLAENLGEVRKVGMDDQEVSLLPVHTYKAPTAAEGGDTDGGDCRVCLTDFNDGDRLRTLPCCHIYHIDCIDQWLKRNAVCPVCRQSARQ